MATHYRFKKDFDFVVRSTVEIAYKAGQEVFIPEAHAEAADKAGVGERIAKEERASEKPEKAENGRRRT